MGNSYAIVDLDGAFPIVSIEIGEFCLNVQKLMTPLFDYVLDT